LATVQDMSWSLGPQLQSEKHTPKYLIREYSSSVADKDRLRDDNTDYNFLSKSKRVLGFFPLEELKHVQSERSNASLANKNSSGIQIRTKTSKGEGNSQQCIDTASCTILVLCV